MTDFFYQEIISGRKKVLPSGYLIGTPQRSKSNFRYVLSLVAAGGMLVAAIGLVAGIITPHAWAAGMFVVGVGLFCIAGYLARRSENVGRRSAQWRPIT